MWQHWSAAGRLTKDPELRYTQSGVAVVSFTLAVDRAFTNAQGEKEADFVNVIAWRKLAETAANYLKKGKPVIVTGTWQQRNYENNEGRKVYIWEVIADGIRFLPDGNGGNQGGNNQGYTPGNAQSNRDPFPDDGQPIDISDDDLPF